MYTSPKASNSSNGDALEDLFSSHWSQVFRLARSWTRNEADAEEVTQEAFLRAFLHLDQLRDKTRFPSWIKTIARNCFLERWKAQEKSVSVPLSKAAALRSPLPDPFTQCYWRERWRILKQPLEDLQDFKQRVISCTALGLTDQQTANLLGRSRASIKCHKTRLRRSLAARLPDD